ncbi:MAG: ATP-binding cassette domain-containing protein [Nostocaceae cyanobacterium]|nr:ATP-binding cassette domain-containing protein [Nostocaceae cyanobacterium]
MAQVVLENVYKSFPARKGERAVGDRTAKTLLDPVPDTDAAGERPESINVLRRINLTILNSEFMVLVGPSGCGKSTLLRVIAGLEEATGGNIWVGDRLVNELPPKERDIAMVFQNYALYPHMSVYENLAFGLRRTTKDSEATPTEAQDKFAKWAVDALVGITRSLPKGLRYTSPKEQMVDERVRSVAHMLQIDSFLHRLPKQLSGGQKQRVALGRAIARNPQVFLMDEPLSNLDAKLRSETRTQIVKLQRQLGTTTIYVTHDQTEAMTMGDRIAVMNAGQIQQVAAPLELYNRPATRFVAEFIGSPPMNFIPVKFHAPMLITHSQFRLTLPEAWSSVLHNYDGRGLILGIRPEHLSVSVPAPKNLPVLVDLVENLGNEIYLSVRLMESKVKTPNSAIGNNSLQVRIPPDRTVRVGEQIWLSLAPEKLHFFDPETDLAIFHR